MRNVCIGVDVGGSSIKIGVFNIGGVLIRKWQIPTKRKNNCDSVIKDIANSIRKQLHRDGIALQDCVGIGMGVPGPVKPDGYVEVCVNMGWRDKYPSKELSEELNNIRVKIGNDANVAALGEVWQGGAKGYDNVIMVTLGTGVGGGVVLGGKIVSGIHGMAGEIGHMHIRDEEQERCNCGGKGCLEQVASATGIAREARRTLECRDTPSILRKYGDKINAKNVLDAAKEGDSIAKEVMGTVSEYIGIALANIALTLDPSAFVIGGGVSKAGEYIRKLIEVEYKHYMPLSKNRAIIVLAKLGNDAGIYGAAKLILD